jgi:hypothetical protein
MFRSGWGGPVGVSMRWDEMRRYSILFDRVDWNRMGGMLRFAKSVRSRVTSHAFVDRQVLDRGMDIERCRCSLVHQSVPHLVNERREVDRTYGTTRHTIFFFVEYA